MHLLPRLYLTTLGLILLTIIGRAQEFRSFDGSGNNLMHTDWGAANAPMLPLAFNSFKDSIGEPGGSDINARDISNIVFPQKKDKRSQAGLSDYVSIFGQFIDHDITLVSNGTEYWPIEISVDDTVMRLLRQIMFFRSKPAPGTGTSKQNPRLYNNEITAFIDGSVIYGSDIKRNTWLRSFKGGKLKMSEGGLLPWNTLTGEFNDALDPNAPEMADDFKRGKKHFVAGDIRANENPLLTTLQTLFVREHNRLCDVISAEHPEYNEEEVFQRARKWVGALLQNITFNEWLPAMGIHLPQYQGYNPEVNPGILNSFAASAYRLGHTLISEKILRLDANGTTIFYGNLPFEEGLFNPKEVLRAGLEPYIKGMAGQVQQEMDCQMIDGLRNFIFNDPKTGKSVGFDLAAINIARGRDRGVPFYNDLRAIFGLERVNTFNDITSDPEVARDLMTAYGDVDLIDSWVGMLAEDHVEGAMVGPLLDTILKDQFIRLRDGDRFYFMNDPDFTEEQKQEIRQTSLSDIILRNTTMDCIQENVFFMEDQAGFRCWPFVVETDLDMSITPMPIVSESKLNIYSKKDQEVHARLIGIDGKEKWAYDYQLSKGENHLTLQVNPLLPRGIYVFILEAGEEFNALKVFIE